MFRILGTLLIALALVAGCRGATGSAGTGGSITVDGAWARPADEGGTSAAYLTLTNRGPGDDSLVGASTPVATSAQLHQTATDDSGMTGMHAAGAVTIEVGKDLVLEPGGYHLMLMGLTQALAPGASFPLTLTFEQAGPVTVSVEVRAG